MPDSTISKISILNYKFRIYPSKDSQLALVKSMRLMRQAWNDMVQATTMSLRKGRTPTSLLRSRLVDMVLTRRVIGRRASAVKSLTGIAGLTHSQAIDMLNQKQIAAINALYGSALAVKYARETIDRSRKSGMGINMGKPMLKVSEKFLYAWRARWNNTCNRPRRNRNANWVAIGMAKTKESPFLAPPNRRKETLVNLSAVLESRYRGNDALCHVRCIQHRPFPSDAVIKDMKVIRTSHQPHAEWYVVVAVETRGDLKYNKSGLACGIDPGVDTPLTVAGENHKVPGQDGFEIDPGKPFHNTLKKLIRLQRKLDRQTRANNPQCFAENGTGIKGQRITTVSKGMAETKAQIAKLYSRAKNIRREVYSLAVNNLLNTYDTIYLGNWREPTSEQSGKKKRERKKAFAKYGVQRARGVASRKKKRNRIMGDNAPSKFRRMLIERAARSISEKRIEVTPEAGTTIRCPCCGELTGPRGLSGLSVRVWTCSNCKSEIKRDRGSAWNIMKAGQQMGRSTAGFKSVRPKRAKTFAPCTETDDRKIPTSGMHIPVLDSPLSGDFQRLTLAFQDVGEAISERYAVKGNVTDVDRENRSAGTA